MTNSVNIINNSNSTRGKLFSGSSRKNWRNGNSTIIQRGSLDEGLLYWLWMFKRNKHININTYESAKAGYINFVLQGYELYVYIQTDENE